MKILSVIFLLAISANLFAQDTIRSLVISEARLSGAMTGYIEITNMGDGPIQLNQFEFGKITPWQESQPFKALPEHFSRLPEKLLHPGESYLMCVAYDYNPEQFSLGFIEEFQERMNKPDLLEIADWIVHLPEGGIEGDSVTLGLWKLFDFDNRHCYYIEQHLPNGDSVVIDQVNGVFDGPNGLNNGSDGYSVAGYMNGSARGTLLRKYSIKQGNADFANARGIGEDDSEWIVVPNQGSVYRKTFWTAGNHVNATIDKNTLESEFTDVDFENKTITVPWGTRRADDIMNYFVKKPGIAWNYHLNNNLEDSLYHAAKTGDKLEVFVCGNKVEKAVFNIIVSEPPASANQVIPVCIRDPEGYWRTQPNNAFIPWPRVTRNESGIDTIWGYGGGIPYATRTDSLLERLEKAPRAKWEFEWVDEQVRPDLINGDILKVTAENGAVKKYFIAVLHYMPKHNAYLASITFPDISTETSLLYGWGGDTIPNFNSTTLNYQLKVPNNLNKIPALVAKTQDINAKVKVNHARSLTGTVEDRRITFMVTAEDDTTTFKYTVELVKEKSPENIQPYLAEPFLSEFVFWDQWSNSFGEICNPGTVPLDLSNYMIAMAWNTNPAEVISSRMGEDEWLERYDKYVPGYKWVNEEKWRVAPGILERDLNVNSIIQPGDVFCLGAIYTDTQAAIANYLDPNYHWPVADALDIQFYNHDGFLDTYHNPWNEAISVNGNPIRKWSNSNWYMFKILNDSIKMGLKPANDPNDFELIETFGMSVSEMWKIAGYVNTWNYWMLHSFSRKPNITKANPALEGSFGTNQNDCEWNITNDFHWEDRGLVYPASLLAVGNNIGQHFFNPITHYMSTISSEFYKVSEGYSLQEKIRGVITGTTVADFLENIIKSDDGQTLKVISLTDGAELKQDVMLTMHDTLVVFSADSTNITKYVLDVSEEGLRYNAVLTSAQYDITVITAPKNRDSKSTGTGTVRGFEYGTSLRTILANINVPAGATLSVIDAQGAYVPTIRLNFDTTYVNVTVNNNIYIDVIAENGITEIIYQLIPDRTENDAFLLSDVYSVSQKQLLIEFVPRGTNVVSFLGNLFPSFGASYKVINKMNQERVDGLVADDDKVVVTSANGIYSQVYYISMLAEKYVPKTTYLAYILSDVYLIDQVEYKISGASAETSIADFYKKIKPVTGATAILVDKDGNEKTTGGIAETDMVKVTSLDGKTVVNYTFGPVTSARVINDESIELYPNPTDGKIYISGLKTGSQIEIYNSTGALIRSIKVQNNIEIISLIEKPAGIYLVHISDKQQLLGSYKIIKT